MVYAYCKKVRLATTWSFAFFGALTSVGAFFTFRGNLEGKRMEEFCCKNCGGELFPYQVEGTLKCKNCGSVFTNSEAEKEKAFLENVLDEIKREKLINLRKRLWEQVNRAYIDSNAIVSVCREIKTVHAEEFLANFFEVANSGTAQEVNEFLDGIDVKTEYASVETVVNFMIKSLQPENLLAVNNLVERAYKTRNLEKFEEVTTRVAEEAKKVSEGVYELTLPRDVFIAYSSKDMAKVQQLVSLLEDQGLSCFVAMRNLQHGRGAVANYEKALKVAMVNCKTFVFVSSQNSRNIGCDAIKQELKFVREDDLSKTPFELRQTPYDKIPLKYKKPRVEWRVDDVKKNVAVERIVAEFFAGLEYCYTAESVLERLSEITLFGFANDEESPENAQIHAIQEQIEEQNRQREEQERILREKLEEQNRLLKEQMESMQKQRTSTGGVFSDDDFVERMAQAQFLAEKKKQEEAERKRKEEEEKQRRIAEEKRREEEAIRAEQKRIAEEKRKAEEIQREKEEQERQKQKILKEPYGAFKLNGIANVPKSNKIVKTFNGTKMFSSNLKVLGSILWSILSGIVIYLCFYFLWANFLIALLISVIYTAISSVVLVKLREIRESETEFLHKKISNVRKIICEGPAEIGITKGWLYFTEGGLEFYPRNGIRAQIIPIDDIIDIEEGVGRIVIHTNLIKCEREIIVSQADEWKELIFKAIGKE